MASFSNRFFALRATAHTIMVDIGELQAVCQCDRFSDKERERAAAVVAIRHLDYAHERARSALQLPPEKRSRSENQGREDQDAYERFLEMAQHDVLQYQTTPAAAANSQLSLLELAINHARDAIKQAQHCYKSHGLVLKACA